MNEDINITILNEWIQSDTSIMLLDVREPNEYQTAHIPKSQLIPLGSLTQRIQELPATGKIIVICRSGNRSALAAQMIRNTGRNDVHNLIGGVIAWSKAKLPLEQGA